MKRLLNLSEIIRAAEGLPQDEHRASSGSERPQGNGLPTTQTGYVLQALRNSARTAGFAPRTILRKEIY